MIRTKLQKFDYSGMSSEKMTYLKSFDFDINFIVGGRSNYKTSTVQFDAIKDFIEKNEKCIRLVRNLDNTKKEYVEEYFTPYVHDEVFKKYGYKIIYDSKKYYLVKYGEDDEIIFKADFMRIVPLSKYQAFKSNNLEKYTTIIFDEFAPEDGTPYLKREVNKLINFISTVNRNRLDNKLKVYLIGNMISIDNIYFTYYGVDAYDLKTNNIYDYTIEGFQRVGVLVVDPVFKNFEDAPRILRSHKHNIQETSQNKYELPADIIDINDIFLYLLVNNYDEFKQRFKIKYVIDVTQLEQHFYYIIGYVDKYNDRNIYFCTEKMDSSDVYLELPQEFLKRHTTHTITNSVVKKPVWSLPLKNRAKFTDRNARKIYYDLKNNDSFQ